MYPWIDKKTNEEVPEMITSKKEREREREREREMMIRQRQMNFLGHVMRRGGIESIAVTGMTEGKRDRERPREKYTDGVARVVGNIQPRELIKATADRVGWGILAANVLEDMKQR